MTGRDVDVLIVGSGPAGSTFARELHEAAPELRVLMVEIGPRLTPRLGENVRNLPPGARYAAQRAAERASGYGDGHSSVSGSISGRIAARPGVSLVQAGGLIDGQDGMPAAALTSNVGGMAAHWTCACPKPGGRERIGFLGAAFDDAFERAESLLGVRRDSFVPTGSTSRLLEELSAMFDEGRSPERRAQPMPLASTSAADGRPGWAGTTEILGPLATGANDRFELVDRTLCRRLLHESGAITGAELVDLSTGIARTVSARAVVVAADALRTPQLLWNSGIRPRALGHYLNDHLQLISAVRLDSRFVPPGDPAVVGAADPMLDPDQHLAGVLWVPFDESLPYHTQIMHLEASPVAVDADGATSRETVLIGRFLEKDIRYEDRVEFSDESDALGMPAIRIRYGLTAIDRANVERGLERLMRDGRHLGTFLADGQPRLLPAGSSMHYQGTTRMGVVDDGTSVCDRDSKVWGTANLFVAGNGVIPTATTCNPTATSVALAVLAARAVTTALR